MLATHIYKDEASFVPEIGNRCFSGRQGTRRTGIGEVQRRTTRIDIAEADQDIRIWIVDADIQLHCGRASICAIGGRSRGKEVEAPRP